MRKLLIQLAKRLENSWQSMAWSGDNVTVQAGWYIAEFVITGVMSTTPKLVIRRQDGRNDERNLVGAHSGRNRMLVFLPAGKFHAYSESIEFSRLARVPSLEGRVRVLLICFRYLLDFFGPVVLLRMVWIQFKPAIKLSNDILEFYTPPRDTVLARLEYWQRRPFRASLLAWWLRRIRIAVVIEDPQQREALISLLLPPEQIILADAEQTKLAVALRKVDYVLPLDNKNTLRSTSLLVLKQELRKAKSNVLLAYSDHDYRAGKKSELLPPVFKPQPSLAYLHCFAYLGPVFAVASSKVQELTASQLLDRVQQYKLQLRLFADVNRCLHIPELLYRCADKQRLTTPAPHNRQSAWPNIDWVPGPFGNRLIASEQWQDLPSVDLLIPTRDGLEFLQPCVEGILKKTDYSNFRITIVDNGSIKPETQDWLCGINQHDLVSVLEFPHEFNFSAINNLAAAHGNGDYLGLINNDIEVINGEWLRQMMVWASQETVGVVGAKLLFGNGLVQHAGVTVGMGNAAGHIHRLEPGDSPGYQNRCVATQNMMAVTAACMITPRSLYEKLGGLNEKQFKVAYNDIDYCLRVENLGWQVIWTPEACLYHHESVSRGDDMSEQHIKRYFKELRYLQKRWKTRGFVDKYYNKHLRIGDEGVYPQIDIDGEDSLILLAAQPETRPTTV